ncbi:MAG: cbb3-type cytochrome c oxidase N-terminal domain-containing protein [Bacteroidota bacterium]
MNRFKKIAASMLVLFPAIANAQNSEEVVGLMSQYQTEIVLSLAVVVSLIGLLTAVVALQTLRLLLKPEEVEEVEMEAKPGFWEKWMTQANAAVPIAQEATVLTSHEYDGIRELDNRLPPWWLYGFYFTIAFGFVYLGYQYLGPGMSQAEEYEYEVALAEERIKTYLASNADVVQINEENVEFVDSNIALSDGASIYKQNCAACHGDQGQGGIGPNFADKYWIHGGDMPSIFKTVKYGVQEKGMISWESLLSPTQMQNVSSYIYTLEGTNPPNPKEAQGELFERVAKEEAPAEESDSTVVKEPQEEEVEKELDDAQALLK